MSVSTMTVVAQFFNVGIGILLVVAVGYCIYRLFGGDGDGDGK